MRKTPRVSSTARAPRDCVKVIFTDDLVRVSGRLASQPALTSASALVDTPRRRPAQKGLTSQVGQWLRQFGQKKQWCANPGCIERFKGNHMFNGKDLSKEPPRSPRVRMGGYSILVRMIDKGRAALNGTVGE